MAFRYILPVLAAATQALAASCSGSTTISTQAEATALAGCQKFSGSITIDKKTKEDIALDGIGQITGSLMAKNVKKMTSLSADSLTSIGKNFELEVVSTLTSLNFPSLTSVDSILWEGLPSLSGLSFTQSVSKAKNVQIVNTNLASLEGINLMEVGTLYLADNLFLEEVNMDLKSVSGQLQLATNGQNLKVTFPNLDTAYNMTYRNVSSLSIPSLKTVKSNFGLYSNFFQSLTAPNLTTIGGGLAIVSNAKLNKIDFPKFTTLGSGLQIANNTKLKEIDGFEALKTIEGNVDMFGAFKKVSLPKIDLVKGAFVIISSKDITASCNKFQAIAGSNNKIRGKFTCRGQQKNVPGTSKSSSSSSSSGGGNSNAATSMLIPYATGFMGIVAAIFGML